MSNKIIEASTYDAIVIGSGISGGWAAMELCKKGFKTLLLERGRNVEHIVNYPTANMNPWEFKFGYNNTNEDKKNDPVQSNAYYPGNKHFFVRDSDHPYVQEKPFNWYRGYQVGGRSLTWGRQCYRLSDLDFEANLRDGIGVDWPIRYKDIESWYSYVESFIGVSGKTENLNHLPDGNFLPPMDLNCIENHLAQSLTKTGDRLLTIARVANLTKNWNNRTACQNRNLCSRGCPFGGYFSSNSSTIPVAFATGNLTLRPHSIVSELLFDEKMQKATGVKVIDALDNNVYEYHSKVIFVNASTIASTGILLNSKSARFPDGFGNDSGQVGRNLMDHHSAAGAFGVHNGYDNSYYKGRRPCGFLIPRFRNLKSNENLDFLRGYNIQGHGERREWIDQMNSIEGFGADFKSQLTKPGPWTIWMAGWGECLPYSDNRVTLDDKLVDKWGLPLLKINFTFRENEKSMMRDIKATCGEMLETAGFKDIDTFNYDKPGGTTIHEMGTARMGNDPKTSVLNCHNQIHAAKNVFVTDGSCMTSSACQNPSLTYMALTARAVHFANQELVKGNL